MQKVNEAQYNTFGPHSFVCREREKKTSHSGFIQNIFRSTKKESHTGFKRHEVMMTELSIFDEMVVF